MAHNIAQIDGKAAMAYQGDTPWHQLGIHADSIPDVDTALKLANLDWEVKLVPMFARDPHAEGQQMIIVPQRRAVLRMTQQKAILGTVGEAYEPIQNRAAFEILDLACREFGVQIETAGALGQGERVWMLAKLPAHFDVVDGDRVDSYFLIDTGHDGATPHTARPTPIRVVCQNTLSMAHASKAVIRLTHSGSVGDKLKMAEKLVADLIKTMMITGETFRAMAQRSMSEMEMHAYIDAVLGIEDGSMVAGILAKRRETVRDLVHSQPGAAFAKDTLWSGYNAFTRYVDHVRPYEVNPVKKQKTFESALFGANAALKARALTLAEQLVEA